MFFFSIFFLVCPNGENECNLRFKACNTGNQNNEVFMMSIVEDVMSCLEGTTIPVKMLMILTNGILTGYVPPSIKPEGMTPKKYQSMKTMKMCILKKKNLVIFKFHIFVWFFHQ